MLPPVLGLESPVVRVAMGTVRGWELCLNTASQRKETSTEAVSLAIVCNFLKTV